MIYDYITDAIFSNLEFLENKKVIIFGTGNAGKFTKYILKGLSVEVICFIDNDKGKKGKNILGTRIETIEILKEMNCEYIILIASTYYKEIIKQLDSMEFNKEKHYINLLEKFEPNEEYGFTVGKHTYGYEQFMYKENNIKSIGAFCSLAPKITIANFNHPLSFISTHPFLYLSNRSFIKEDLDEVVFSDYNKKIEIGNDVWIGSNVTILPNVKIGNGAVIGAGAVVNKDIPDYAVAVGVPAKVIKYRFSREEIKVLNASKWWEWNDDKIKENVLLFRDKNEFIRELRNLIGGEKDDK
ncbi:CatB-related O-acetyltransferase [Clostridium felsineum]|uniref:2,3,4,5-tetrahydropyridine-2,6-dicarboxylate N-acetyltransferase n=1 Tax=Clostridium felsineum TaxID=36839 RepID=A0A1S8MDD5_9CLOT|nr:CatB-related O-acetyltransferase [Clostridium felsineum]URZ06314.1 2,3,4,5-tetrahydropyridine-2,6-dicarboxylate N-acetyltransferase [Clostridium felsineum]URZ11349.1 2,3,4,5-tetrahydropyridine-2,6-dicarboxylate N-acetyltransferase [Clostridium felsineum]